MNLRKCYARFPTPVKNLVRFGMHLVGRYRRKTFSQEGEDILLARLFEDRKSGFYVDVGAHHPSSCSNTYYFYRKGWRGINIDAMPGSMRLFKLIRPKDINLEIAISDRQEVLEFHSFNNPLFNSADKELAQARRTEFGEAPGKHNVFQVQADTLGAILEQYLPPGMPIDFLSVDVEGLDLKVLKSNDWSRFRPKYVLVEILGQSIPSMLTTETCRFMESVGYYPISKLVHTVVFMESDPTGIAYS